MLVIIGVALALILFAFIESALPRTVYEKTPVTWQKMDYGVMGMSGTPITGWTYYDTQYTSRTVNLPSLFDNESTYNYQVLGTSQMIEEYTFPPEPRVVKIGMFPVPTTEPTTDSVIVLMDGPKTVRIIYTLATEELIVKTVLSDGTEISGINLTVNGQPYVSAATININSGSIATVTYPIKITYNGNVYVRTNITQ